MRRAVAARLAWGMWAGGLVAIGAFLLLDGDGAGGASSVAGAVFILAFSTTGGLVVTRHPRNPVGWLLCLTALAFTVGGLAVAVSDHAVRTRQVDGPVVAAAAWTGSWVWMAGIGPAATFLLLLFPDGRLPSPRWRPVAWLAGAAVGSAVVGVALAPGPIDDTPVVNPLGLPGAGGVLDAAAATGLVLLLVSILLSCASLAARYRAAPAEQRQQLKWVAYALPLVLLWLAASVVLESTHSGDAAVDLANTLVSVGLTVVPVTIGVAMLRYRLYDIDVVINRTLVYGSLTAALASVYLVSVLVLQLVLSPLTDRSDLAVAASTLAVAALFRPVRAHVQAVVDRRFFRRRYDAVRTLEGFASRLRQEVDLEAVSQDLTTAVRDTVAPAHVSVWLRGAP